MNNENGVKSGKTTTEFWMAIFTPLISLLVAFGVVSQDEGDQVIALVRELFAGILALFGVLLPVIEYIKSRGKVKASVNGSK